jgi:hypothetical protein
MRPKVDFHRDLYFVVPPPIWLFPSAASLKECHADVSHHRPFGCMSVAGPVGSPKGQRSGSRSLTTRFPSPRCFAGRTPFGVALPRVQLLRPFPRCSAARSRAWCPSLPPCPASPRVGRPPSGVGLLPRVRLPAASGPPAFLCVFFSSPRDRTRTRVHGIRQLQSRGRRQSHFE